MDEDTEEEAALLKSFEEQLAAAEAERDALRAPYEEMVRMLPIGMQGREEEVQIIRDRYLKDKLYLNAVGRIRMLERDISAHLSAPRIVPTPDMNDPPPPDVLREE
jgi:hypothetical protein